MDNLPPPVQVTKGDRGNKPPDDDSLIEGGFKVKNPFQKFFDWIKNFIKNNQNITIKIPIIGIFIALSSFSVGVGSGYNWGFNNAVAKFFPDSSPILHRAITVSGIIQKSSSEEYYLKSDGNMWTLKPVKPVINLEDYLNQQVTVKGNLTKEKLVIEVSEIISSKISSPNIPTLDVELPKLYSGLQWELAQKRILLFTSGKRRIDVEGFHLESSQVSAFPQDFINYYLQELKARGFKETLNSISPDGITITYAKDDSFLTFGIKNKYSGSGDKKQIAGYTAFIEHN